MHKKINIIICILLLVTPFLIWGNVYLAGGDDAKLYYVFPFQYIKNFATNLSHQNTLSGAQTGYQPLSYFVPLFGLILLLKIIPLVSTQMLLYGINIMCGYIGYRFFLKELTSSKNVKESFEQIVASIVYISSGFLGFTIYNHQLPVLYLVGLLPWAMFFFLRSISKQMPIYAIASAACISIGSVGLINLPWAGAFFVTSIPFLIYLACNYPKAFIKSFIASTLSIIVLNLYWLVPFVDSQFISSSTNISTSYLSKNFLDENIRIAKGVSTQYDISSIFQLQLHQRSSNFVGLIVVLTTLIILTKNSHRLKICMVLLSLLVSFYCISPNVSEGGVNLFIWMVKNIPLWGMFRNMQDKFSLSVAFWFATSVYFALISISNLKKSVFTLAVLISSFISVINYIPELKKNSESRSVFSGHFNSEFEQLLTYIKSISDSHRYMWLPLNYPAYVALSDSRENLYTGPSPLRELVDKDDMTGQFSFLTSNNIDWGKQIFNDLALNDNASFYDAINKLDIKYIITNSQDLPLTSKSFFYGGNNYPILSFQTNKLMKQITGEKIVSFGRYSLFTVNKKILKDDSNYISIPYSSRWSSINTNSENIYPAANFGINVKGSREIVFKFPKQFILLILSSLIFVIYYILNALWRIRKK